MGLITKREQRVVIVIRVSDNKIFRKSLKTCLYAMSFTTHTHTLNANQNQALGNKVFEEEEEKFT